MVRARAAGLHSSSMFGPMLLGAAAGSVASYLSVRQFYRQELGAMTLREARLLSSMEVTPIAQASEGFVRLEGTLRAQKTVLSYYDRVPCAALELFHFDIVPSKLGPRRLLLRTERRIEAFFVEDESGRVLVAPDFVRLDGHRAGAEEDSTVEEHSLRDGERVVLFGTVRRGQPRLGRALRDAGDLLDTGLEFTEPPLVTWRSEPEVYPRLLPPLGNVALSAGSAAMAVLGAVLQL